MKSPHCPQSEVIASGCQSRTDTHRRGIPISREFNLNDPWIAPPTLAGVPVSQEYTLSQTTQMGSVIRSF